MVKFLSKLIKIYKSSLKTTLGIISKFKFYYKIRATVKINRETYYILAPFGIGDIIIICMLFESLKKKYGDNIKIIAKKKFSDIPRIFNLFNNFIFFEYSENSIIQTKQDRIKKGKIFVPHSLLNPELLGIERVLGYKSISLIDYYKIIFDLDENCAISSPDLNNIDFSGAKSFFEKERINPEGTIILFPEANSVELLPIEFWQKVVTKLENLELNTIINLNIKSELKGSLSQYRIMSLGIMDTIAACILSKKIISIRSGMLDMLYFSGSKIVSLYPNQASLQKFNIKNLYGDNELVLEVIYNNELADPQTKQIINFIANFNSVIGNEY